METSGSGGHFLDVRLPFVKEFEQHGLVDIVGDHVPRIRPKRSNSCPAAIGSAFHEDYCNGRAKASHNELLPWNYMIFRVFFISGNRTGPESHTLLQCNNPPPPHNNRECQSSTRAMSMTSRVTLAIVWPRSIASLRIAW